MEYTEEDIKRKVDEVHQQFMDKIQIALSEDPAGSGVPSDDLYGQLEELVLLLPAYIKCYEELIELFKEVEEESFE